MHRLSTLENKYSNIFFYKTIAPTVLKFYMEHDQPPGSQNYKIGSGRISKMAPITKNSKNNKINFLSIFSSAELAQGELLGYRDVRRPSYVWTSVTSETSETSVRQLFSLCTL